MLVLPQLAGHGMEGEALRIAVAVTPDLRLGRPADERIVRRCRTIGADADDLAEMVIQILRLVTGGEMFTHGEKEIVVRRLHDAAAEMIAAGERSCLMEDHLDRLQSGRTFVEEPSTGEGGACAAVHRLGITEIDRVILREAAIEHEVEQTSLACGEDFRYVGEGGRESAVLGNDAHAPGPFGDQHAAVR